MTAKEMIDDLLKRGKIEPNEHIAIQLQMAGEKLDILPYYEEPNEWIAISQVFHKYRYDGGLETSFYVWLSRNYHAPKKIDSTPQADNWISVEDYMPKHYQDVLVCNSNDSEAPICTGFYTGFYTGFEKSFHINEADEKSDQVTHWQPLPALPTTKEKKEL